MNRQKKTSKSGTLWVIVLFLIAGVLGGFVAGYFYNNPQISNLNREINQLNGDILGLNSGIDVLNSSLIEIESKLTNTKEELTSLNIEHEELKNEFDILHINYNNLNSNYSELQNLYDLQISDCNFLSSKYNSLENAYDDLTDEFNIEKTLRIGHLLEDYFDKVRDLFGIDAKGVEFATNLAEHNLGRIYWPALRDDFYEKSNGEYSNLVSMDVLLEVIELVGVKSYDPSVDKVKKILLFVKTNIHYEYDLDDKILFPVETLGFKSGDCEDYTVLIAALFELVGLDTAIGSFKNDKNEYHMMVLLHLDNLDSYGYWFYNDLTDLGLKSGKWIKIEPQYTIDNQNNDWVKQWNLLDAEEID
jgi:hypothetical protein